MPTADRSRNRDDVAWEESTHGSAFTIRRKHLGDAAGSEMLGCSLYELPPGRRTYPYHYHTGNEEAMYVLSGEGTLRTESRTRTIREGDYVAFPRGQAGAHQVHNSSDRSLEYLCVSTRRLPDVIVYPDSEKVLATDRIRASDEGFGRMLRMDREVDYWDGEPTDPDEFEQS